MRRLIDLQKHRKEQERRQVRPEILVYTDAILGNNGDTVAALERQFGLNPQVAYDAQRTVEMVIDQKCRDVIRVGNKRQLFNLTHNAHVFTARRQKMLSQLYIQSLAAGRTDVHDLFEQINFGPGTLQSFVQNQIIQDPALNAELTRGLVASFINDANGAAGKIAQMLDPYSNPAIIFAGQPGKTFKDSLYEALVSGRLNAESVFKYTFNHYDDLKAMHAGKHPFLATILDSGNSAFVNAYIKHKLQTGGCPLSYKEVSALRLSPHYQDLSDQARACIDAADSDNALMVRGYQFLCARQDAGTSQFVQQALTQQPAHLSELFKTYLYITTLPFGIRESIISMAFSATNRLAENIGVRADQMGTRSQGNTPIYMGLARRFSQGAPMYMNPAVTLSDEFTAGRPEPKEKRFKISDR